MLTRSQQRLNHSPALWYMPSCSFLSCHSLWGGWRRRSYFSTCFRVSSLLSTQERYSRKRNGRNSLNAALPVINSAHAVLAATASEHLAAFCQRIHSHSTSVTLSRPVQGRNSENTESEAHLPTLPVRGHSQRAVPPKATAAEGALSRSNTHQSSCDPTPSDCFSNPVLQRVQN